jgi:hypothetical protein
MELLSSIGKTLSSWAAMKQVRKREAYGDGKKTRFNEKLHSQPGLYRPIDSGAYSKEIPRHPWNEGP